MPRVAAACALGLAAVGRDLGSCAVAHAVPASGTNLEPLENRLRSMYMALQRNAQGLPEAADIHWLARRYVHTQHGWMVHGFGPRLADRNASGAEVIPEALRGAVVAAVSGERGRGFSLGEVARLVAALEHAIVGVQLQLLRRARAISELAAAGQRPSQYTRLVVYTVIFLLGNELGEFLALDPSEDPTTRVSDTLFSHLRFDDLVALVATTSLHTVVEAVVDEVSARGRTQAASDLEAVQLLHRGISESRRDECHQLTRAVPALARQLRVPQPQQRNMAGVPIKTLVCCPDECERTAVSRVETFAGGPRVTVPQVWAAVHDEFELAKLFSSAELRSLKKKLDTLAVQSADNKLPVHGWKLKGWLRVAFPFTCGAPAPPNTSHRVFRHMFQEALAKRVPKAIARALTLCMPRASASIVTRSRGGARSGARRPRIAAGPSNSSACHEVRPPRPAEGAPAAPARWASRRSDLREHVFAALFGMSLLAFLVSCEPVYNRSRACDSMPLHAMTMLLMPVRIVLTLVVVALDTGTRMLLFGARVAFGADCAVARVKLCARRATAAAAAAPTAPPAALVRAEAETDPDDGGCRTQLDDDAGCAAGARLRSKKKKQHQKRRPPNGGTRATTPCGRCPEPGADSPGLSVLVEPPEQAITCGGKVSTRNRARLITYSCAIQLGQRKNRDWAASLGLIEHLWQGKGVQPEEQALLQELCRPSRAYEFDKAMSLLLQVRKLPAPTTNVARCNANGDADKRGRSEALGDQPLDCDLAKQPGRLQRIRANCVDVDFDSLVFMLKDEDVQAPSRPAKDNPVEDGAGQLSSVMCIRNEYLLQANGSVLQMSWTCAPALLPLNAFLG